MKFLLVVTVLLVTLEFAPSALAAPVLEEEAEAVLEQIRMLVASAENRVHESQEESIPTATPSTQPPTITVSSSTAAPPSQPSSSTTVPSSTASHSSQPPNTVPSATSSQPPSTTVPSATSSQPPSPTVPSSTAAPSTQPPIHPPTPQKLFRCSPFHSSYQWGLRCYFCMDYESGVQDVLCNWRWETMLQLRGYVYVLCSVKSQNIWLTLCIILLGICYLFRLNVCCSCVEVWSITMITGYTL